MELYLLRHAQSLNNALPMEQRVEDPGLTELGFEQARRLGLYMSDLRLTRLITSPFRRALETAQQIRLAAGLTPEVWTDLHEKGGCVSGVAPPDFVGRPGMTRDEIQREFRVPASVSSPRARAAGARAGRSTAARASCLPAHAG